MAEKGKLVYAIYLIKPIDAQWQEPFIYYSDNEELALAFLNNARMAGEYFPVLEEWLILKSETYNTRLIKIYKDDLIVFLYDNDSNEAIRGKLERSLNT